jgi:Flp pilus assembly protein TadB
MNVAVSLWHLILEDRLVRWASYATAAIVWFAIAWADLGILLVGMAMVAVLFWWLRRQRERRGWFQEREVDIDLL